MESELSYLLLVPCDEAFLTIKYNKIRLLPKCGQSYVEHLFYEKKIGIVLIVFHFEILLVDIKYYLLIG